METANQNPRKSKFASLESHPWYSRQYKKLKKEEIKLIAEILTNDMDLSKCDFEIKVNRMFLYREKTKNWALVTEILLVTNTAA